MRRLKFMPLMAVVGAMCLFTACSDDDDYVQMPGDGLEAKTYTMADGLTVTLNGDVAYGQAVTFTPGQNGNATITIKGSDLNVGELIGGMMSKADNTAGFSIPTASMIPGSVQVEIPVQLTLDNEGVNTFSGNATTDYCTFNYAGKVTPESLTMAVTDLKLKNTSLAGTYKMNDWVDYLDDSFPFRIVWEAEKAIEAMGDWPMQDCLMATVSMFPMIPVGDNTLTVAAALPAVLKSVTFEEDGDIIAEYVDTKAEGLPVKTSVSGLAKYVVTGSNTIKVYLYPQAIMKEATSEASKSSRAIDYSQLLEGIMTQVVPMLSQGVNVQFGPAIAGPDVEADPNQTSFYLDTATLLPILKIASPVLRDEDMMDMIMKAVEKDESFGQMAPLLGMILASVPDIIDTTEKVELGINLVKE